MSPLPFKLILDMQISVASVLNLKITKMKLKANNQNSELKKFFHILEGMNFENVKLLNVVMELKKSFSELTREMMVILSVSLKVSKQEIEFLWNELDLYNGSTRWNTFSR